MRKLFSSIPSLFSTFFKHSGFVVELGVVLFVALVWFAGPLIGIESVETRVQIIIGIILLRFLVYVARYYLAQRSAAQLEVSLQQQARNQLMGARPDRKEELEAVRRQFDKGIAALKESKLGKGLQGKAALYALPWYMFIGPPASGKSTALRHSGLQFPYLGESGQGLQGVGGTRNCDWWFTNEAVLLDTAGRYVTQDEDQEEWLSFLDLLNRHRKGRAINGVIAAISIADVLQGSDEELEVHAKKIRSRIDELMKRLGMTFPVYLMFTKCDLIQGFVEFFEDLNRSERERVWGCTLAMSAAKDTPGSRFQSEFQELIASLEARRLTRLANTRGPYKISIFGFPLQLAAACEKLTRFVDTLFQTNQYQENPVFRGLYFSSGTQEGTPIDRILSAVSRASGLGEMIAPAVNPSETKSYFLKDFFTTVVFPDQALAGPSSAIHRQQGYLRVATFVLAVLLVIGSVAGLAFSFIGNKQLISGALSASLNAPMVGLTDAASFEKNIEFLDKLGTRFDSVRSYDQEGIPLRLWGLYRGDRLGGPLREIYVRHFERLFLMPTKHEMEEELEEFATTPGEQSSSRPSDYYYSVVKAYIMLGEPSRVSPPYLERWLSNHWRVRLKSLYARYAVPEWVEGAVSRQMSLYSHHLAVEMAGHLALNRPLVHEVQRRLRQVPIVERLYGLSLQEVENSIRPYSLETALQGGYQGTLTSDYSIPGIYTLEGWTGPFQEGLSRALGDLGQEAWVIGEPDIKRVDLELGVKKLYFADYVRHWRAFLKSIRVRQVVTPLNAEEMLATLSQPDSSLVRVLEVVDRNTVPESEGMAAVQDAAAGLFEKVKKQLGLESIRKTVEKLRKEGEATDFHGLVSVRFMPVHQLLNVPKDSKEITPLAQYLAELRKAHQTLRPMLRSETAGPDTKAMARSIVLGEPNDLMQGVKTTDALIQKLDSELRESVLSLLVEPWLMVMRGVLARAKTDIDRRWETDVFQACQRSIEPRYPFRPTGEDAAVADVVNFFHPQNGILWRFYQAELKPFVEESGEHWEPKTWHSVGMSLSEEFLSIIRHGRYIAESLFVKGAPDMGTVFEVYPYPPQGLASRAVSEIRLEIGGQPLRYRMEPQEWQEIKWPGSTTASGASLQVQVGNAWVTKDYKDVWGLFKLIEAGRVVPGDNDAQVKVQWELQGSDSRSIQVKYDLRGQSYKNPFRPGMFQKFRCIQHL